MNRERACPSRKLQITIIILLVIGGALALYMPPLTRQGRAEKLYEDAWCTKGLDPFVLMDMDEKPDKVVKNSDESIRKLEKALEIDPGNSLYEQSLVWYYDHKKLPELLLKRKLGPDARHLAAGLIFEADKTKDPAQRLERLKALTVADPDNALAHYMLASQLKEMNHMPEAITEIQIGNRANEIRLYQPEVSEKVLWTLGYVNNTLSIPHPSIYKLRKLAVALKEESRQSLRDGDVKTACGTLETGRDMGLKLMTTQPLITHPQFFGVAIFKICTSSLEPIYKKYNMKDCIDSLKIQKVAVKHADGELNAFIYHIWEIGSVPKAYLAIIVLLMSVIAPVVCLGLSLLFWIPAELMYRKRHQEVISGCPWCEGWIVRLFFSVYVVIALAAVALAMTRPFDYTNTGIYHGIPFVSFLLAQLIILSKLLRTIHHRYDVNTGERTGMLRFMLKAPATAKAWARRYLAAAFLGQMLFSICCVLLVIIIFRPLTGGNPLQFSRYPFPIASQESLVAGRVAADIKSVMRDSEHISVGKLNSK